MKHKFRYLIAAVAAMVLALVFAAGCAGGGGKKATLKLDAANGTIATSQYELAAGADLYEFLKDKAPVPEDGLTFAAWYLDGKPIKEGDTMSEGGGTVIAKYYATYTLEVYLEGESGFVKSETSGKTDRAIFGDPLTLTAPSIEHYTLDGEQEGTRLESAALGKNEVFKAYYRLTEYYVSYRPNAPADAELTGTIQTVSARYGSEVTLSDGHGYTVAPQYRFAGWSTSPNGPVQYRAGEKLAPTDDVVLFAMWDHAYYDRFGGADLIFFPQADEDAAVLVRAGKEFMGTRDGEKFSFKDAEGVEFLKGKAAAGTFIYFREAMAGITYKHADAYTNTVHADASTLVFDGYDGATFTDKEGAHAGTVTYDPETLAYTFAYAANASEGFLFSLTDVTDGDTVTPAFLVCGGEANFYFHLKPTYLGNNQTDAVFGDLLYLDGYGIALLIDGQSFLGEGAYVVTGSGSYAPVEGKEGEIELQLLRVVGDTATTETMRIKLKEYGRQLVWCEKTAAEGTFEGEGNATLVLDGYGDDYSSAEYTYAAGKKTGMYIVETSVLGTNVRFIPEQGDIIVFRIDVASKTFAVLQAGGEYIEYFRYYGDSQSRPVNGPMLILKDGGKAVYYPTEKAVEGTVSAIGDQQERFLFRSDALNADNSPAYQFEYELGGGYFSIGGAISYYHYFKMYPVETDRTRTLTEKDGTGKILAEFDADRAQNNAVYTDSKGEVHLGFYSILSSDDAFYRVLKAAHGEKMGFSIAQFIDISTSDIFLFALYLDEDESKPLGERDDKFAVLGGGTGMYTYYAGTSFLFEESEDEEASVYLALLSDGTDRLGVYCDGETSYAGTYELVNGEVIFTYEQGKTFHFLLTGDGGFSVHTDMWTGSLTLQGEHTIVLDGYFNAKYDDLDAEYTFTEDEGVVRIFLAGIAGEDVFEAYFDLDLEHGTYQACGYEVGHYIECSNIGIALELDGHENVTRYDAEGNETHGTYKVIDLANGIVDVTIGETTFTVMLFGRDGGEGKLNLMFSIMDTAAGTYVSSRWEFFTFDGFITDMGSGNALFTDVYGITYEGTYSKRSEHGYVFSSDLLGETLYIILGENGTFTTPSDGFIVDGKVLVKYLGTETEIVLDDNIEEIAAYAFTEAVYGTRYDGAPITSIDLKNVTKVGKGAFNGCRLLETVTGEHVTEVGDSAFYACSELRSVTLPSVQTVGEFAFHLCESLQSIDFESAKILYSSAFDQCWELVSVNLPAAEQLFEGVFYDCFLLETVTLGPALTQIGTSDDRVTGVFERTPGEAQAPLTLILKGENVPSIGADLFKGVDYYTVKVPTMSVVKEFYQSESWAGYSINIGVADTPRQFYYYNYGAVWSLELDGTVKINRGTPTSYGAYELKDGQLLVYKGGLTDPVVFGDVDDAAHTILIDIYGNGETSKSDWYSFYEAGNVLKLSVSGTDNEADTLTFTPVKGNFYTNSPIFEVDGVLVENGVEKSVKIILDKDMYGDTTLYMVVDGKYRRSMSITVSSKTVSLGTPTFIPVVNTYHAADESELTITQNDEAATQYTAAFTITSIVDGSGNALTVSKIDVEKQADGKTFKAKTAYVFDGYSYLFTFVIGDDGSFTYTHEAQRRTVITSEDGRFQVIIFQNANGTIASVTPYVDDYGTFELLEAETDGYVCNHASDSMTYEWIIYEYNYAGHYTLTLTGNGDTLSGEIASGKVAKGYLNNTYAIVFYAGDDIFKLYMRGMDKIYFEVLQSEITDQDTYLEVTHGMTYYLTVNGESVEIVIADITYQSSEDSDLAGSLHIVTGSDGVISSATLTVGTETYTKFLMAGDAYLFIGTEKAYRVGVSADKCTIAEREIRTFTDETSDAEITVVVESDDVIGIISVKVGGTEYAAHLGSLYTSWRERIILVDAETPMCFVVNVGENTMWTVKLLVAETEDQDFRLYLAVADDGTYQVVGLKHRFEGQYFWETIDYTVASEDSCEVDIYADRFDEYNSIVYLYFRITIDGDTCSATLYDISGY